MRSLCIAAALGLAALAPAFLTPGPAQAHGRRFHGGAVYYPAAPVVYYQPCVPAYYAPRVYYAPPMYARPPYAYRPPYAPGYAARPTTTVTAGAYDNYF